MSGFKGLGMAAMMAAASAAALGDAMEPLGHLHATGEPLRRSNRHSGGRKIQRAAKRRRALRARSKK